MRVRIECIDFTREPSMDEISKQSTDKIDEKDEFPKFQLNKLTHLRGCQGELLEGIEDQWLGKIDSRVKITQGKIIYILTENQIEEFNNMILRKIEPSDSEDLEAYFRNNLITYEKRA